MGNGNWQWWCLSSEIGGPRCHGSKQLNETEGWPSETSCPGKVLPRAKKTPGEEFSSCHKVVMLWWYRKLLAIETNWPWPCSRCVCACMCACLYVCLQVCVCVCVQRWRRGRAREGVAGMCFFFLFFEVCMCFFFCICLHRLTLPFQDQLLTSLHRAAQSTHHCRYSE